MADPIDSVTVGLLARKGEARPALQSDNDNIAGIDEPGSAVAMIEAAIVLADGRRAAFTLRLDPLRHMRLRLACTLGRRSAQAIVSEALDAHLKTIPGIERLVAAAMAESGERAAKGQGTER